MNIFRNFSFVWYYTTSSPNWHLTSPKIKLKIFKERKRQTEEDMAGYYNNSDVK
jgi:hypothetical protein